MINTIQVFFSLTRYISRNHLEIAIRKLTLNDLNLLQLYHKKYVQINYGS